MRDYAATHSARRAVAGIVLFGAVLTAIKIADYKQRGLVIVPPNSSGVSPPPGILPHRTVFPDSWYAWATPWWAYVIAVVVGLLGLALASLIYSVRRTGRGEVPDTLERWLSRARSSF